MPAVKEKSTVKDYKLLPEGAQRVQPSKGIKGITRTHVQQLCARDTFFTAREMVRLNFADRLLDTNDLVGGYVNPNMHGLPTGLDSLNVDSLGE